MSRIYDNWDRLVAATLKREQFRFLARADSLDSSFSSIGSDSPFHVLSNVSISPSQVGKSSTEIPPTRRYPITKEFSYNELRKATGNFGPNSLLGGGPFTTVYKGWIDQNTLSPARPGSGLAVAVQKLKFVPRLPDHELMEVNYLGQFHHPHLVKLIGYCLDGVEQILVYEFMPKGNLKNHLSKRSQSLSWTTRIKVATGVARGLSFLHEIEQQGINGVFMDSDILLDSNFNAKLANFRMVKADKIHDRTHISTQFIGMDVYGAPEFLATGDLTAKSNVYNFGVILLELLSGHLPSASRMGGYELELVAWAKEYLGDVRNMNRIMDIKLGGQYPQMSAYKVASIALQCLHLNPEQRPQMADIVSMLEELQSSEGSAEHL